MRIGISIIWSLIRHGFLVPVPTVMCFIHSKHSVEVVWQDFVWFSQIQNIVGTAILIGWFVRTKDVFWKTEQNSTTRNLSILIILIHPTLNQIWKIQSLKVDHWVENEPVNRFDHRPWRDWSRLSQEARNNRRRHHRHTDGRPPQPHRFFRSQNRASE